MKAILKRVQFSLFYPAISLIPLSFPQSMDQPKVWWWSTWPIFSLLLLVCFHLCVFFYKHPQFSLFIPWFWHSVVKALNGGLRVLASLYHFWVGCQWSVVSRSSQVANPYYIKTKHMTLSYLESHCIHLCTISSQKFFNIIWKNLSTVRIWNSKYQLWYWTLLSLVFLGRCWNNLLLETSGSSMILYLCGFLAPKIYILKW